MAIYRSSHIVLIKDQILTCFIPTPSPFKGAPKLTLEYLPLSEVASHVLKRRDVRLDALVSWKESLTLRVPSTYSKELNGSMGNMVNNMVSIWIMVTRYKRFLGFSYLESHYWCWVDAIWLGSWTLRGHRYAIHWALRLHKTIYNRMSKTLWAL